MTGGNSTADSEVTARFRATSSGLISKLISGAVKGREGSAMRSESSGRPVTGCVRIISGVKTSAILCSNAVFKSAAGSSAATCFGPVSPAFVGIASSYQRLVAETV